MSEDAALKRTEYSSIPVYSCHSPTVAHHSSLHALEPRLLVEDLHLCVWWGDSCRCV